MKRWEPLGIGDYGILQDSALGCFTGDSVLLTHFARIRPDDRVLDIGTGNGILCLYGCALYGGSYQGVDTNAAQIALANASADRNGMRDVHFSVMEAVEARRAFTPGSFDVCLCNPPYYTTGDVSPNLSRARSRHAAAELLDSFLQTAFLLLKNGGRLYLCYPAAGLADAVCTLRDNRLEPKRMRTEPAGKRPRLLLIETKKLAKAGLRVE